MSNTKLEQLDKELSSLNSSKQKLDYWKSNFYDRFMKEANLMDFLGNIIEYKPIYEEDDIIASKVFEYFECESVQTSARIPGKIHNNHFPFPGFEKDIEYTNWFLIFNAEKWARGYYINKFQPKIGNKITDELIEAELNELKNFEDKATAYLLAKEIKIEDDYQSPGLRPFQELKRIESDYYKGKIIPSFNLMGGDSLVDVYAKHIYFKEWLKKSRTIKKDQETSDWQIFIEKFQEINKRFDVVENMIANIPSKPTSNSGDIKIFLASSSELKDDRDAFDLYFRTENDHLREEGIYLKIVRWENFLDAMSETRLQDEYNKEVRDCDIFVSLFLTKTGKFTEEEFNIAHQQFMETTRPKIFTLFRKGTLEISEITEEILTLINFKKRLSELGHYHTDYENTQHLLLKFKDQLRLLLKKGL